MATYPLMAMTGLGSLYVGVTSSVRYKVISIDGSELVAATNSNVEESDVPGNYWVVGGVVVPADAAGRILWSGNEGANWLTEDPFDLGYMQAQAQQIGAYSISQNPLAQGETLSALRGDSLTATITGLGDLSTRSKLWFGVKRNPAEDADAASVVLIEESVGLVCLNGAAGTANQGGLEVVDAGAIEISLSATATSTLRPGRYSYEVQMLGEGLVSTLTQGVFRVSADVVRAVA